MKKSILSMLALSVVFASCSKDESEDNSATSFGHVESMADLKVPSAFDWRSAKNVAANISVNAAMGEALEGIRVDIYSEDPNEGGKLISSGFTNESGMMQQELKVDGYLDEVFVIAHAGGIDNMKSVPLTGASLNVQMGNSHVARTYKKGAAGNPTLIPGFSNVYALGTWDANGTPNYLVSPIHSLDSIQHCATKVMAALPEYQSVPCNPVRQHLVFPGVQTELVVTAQSDVYATFLDEGATIQNTLVYFYYHPDSTSGPWAKPGNPAAIDSIFVVFPNVEESNNIIQSGDRVKLGNFPAGTHISWGLIQGGFSNGNVQPGFDTFYSLDALNDDEGNTCAGPTFDRHVVSMKKELDGDSVIVFGFEDITFPGGDFDFNDAVWYVDGDNLSTSKKPNLTAGRDSDGDGIDDNWDDYPQDPNRACDLYYQGTLAFEDLWPVKGDYDMNDHVIYYDVVQTITGSMDVIEIKGDWEVRANGAGFDNGFGFKLPGVDKSQVSSVTGTAITGGTPTESNGLETTPSQEAVVLAWDEAKTIIPGNPVFYNTQGAPQPYLPLNIDILFDANSQLGLPSMMALGSAPYNPFIISNQDRGREIHLVDMEPTDIAVNAGVNAYLGTGDDASAGSDYYQTANNLPWALDIPYGWEWPKEQVDIVDAYSDFAAWAMSGGMSFPAWYLSPDPSKVY